MDLDVITYPARIEPVRGVLVVLHGWGANAQDVAALAAYLDLPNYQLCFPNAPFPFPYGPAGRMWYDLPADYSFFSRPEFRDQPELRQSRQLLTDWLLSLEQTTGIPLAQTVLAGFSQGGAMTLDVGLQLPLAALMVLSGYLHAPPEVATLTQPLPKVLMVHGRQDQVVPLLASYQARDRLLELGASVHYHELAMGHEVQPAVLKLMQSFIEEMTA